jgi:hypothetical protein
MNLIAVSCAMCQTPTHVSQKCSKAKKRLVCAGCIQDKTFFCSESTGNKYDDQNELEKYYNFETKQTKYLREDVDQLLLALQSEEYHQSPLYGNLTEEDRVSVIFQFCGKSRIDFGKLVEMDVINTFIQLGLINEEDDETFFEEAKFYYRKFYA